MENLDAELTRIKKLKAEKQSDMIEAARDEIFHLLEGVGAQAEEVLKESAKDLHVAREDWNEDLLERLEEFLVMLGGMRERATKIAANVQKRERLVDVREKLDTYKVDYRARGGTGVQNQAKVIDGMKKDLKKLPAVTDELRKMLREWQNGEGFPFRYKGREYLKVIEESDMQWQRKKEVNRRAKMYGGVDACPMSPSLSRRGGGSGSSSGGSSTCTSSNANGAGIPGDSVPAAVPTSPNRSCSIHGSMFNTTGGCFQRPQSVRMGGGGAAGASMFATSTSTTPTGDGGRSDGGGGSGSVGRTGKLDTAASSLLGTGSGTMVDARSYHGEVNAASKEGSRDPAPPVTPRKKDRNPLLTSSGGLRGFHPRPLAGVFSSAGGNLRLPPPPLPERPTSLRMPQAISRIRSTMELARAALSPTREVRVGSATIVGSRAGDSRDDGDGEGVDGEIVRAGPPPLPDRPSRAFERADLGAIRESNTTLRSSASASDVLSIGRQADASTVSAFEGGE